MVDSLGFFVELDEPCSLDNFGWYIAGDDIYRDCYLHDDGVVYESCAPRFNVAAEQISTGWYADEFVAVLCANKYYNKYGLKYSYNIPAAEPATNNIESQVMEFE